VNGLILMAGNYEFTQPNPPPHVVAYFGSDAASRAKASAIAGVVASELPVLLVISQLDSLGAHRQTKLLADALYERDGRNANLMYLPGHNHVSLLSHLNAADIDDRLLSDRLAEFIRICGARFAQPLPA
jgi:alpha-beta hydrolase superfamily lysophospholipase